MARFNQGENIKLRLYVSDPDTDALFDPSSLPAVVVLAPDGTTFLASSNMTKISTGYYTYNLATTATSLKGTYQVQFTVTNSALITILWGSFDLGR